MDNNAIIQKLKELGYSPVPAKFYSMIDVWNSWYMGDVNDFHHYSVYNGIVDVDCKRFSVGMGKKVCEDWANLLMNEKVEITLEGKSEQAFVDKVFSDNNFWVKISEYQERKSAKGTVAYVPMLEGMTVEQGTGNIIDGGRLHINFCSASNIYPLSWSNGSILECAFTSQKDVDDKKYTYIQIHKLANGLYDIENRLFLAGEEIPLSSVRGFENVPEVIKTGSDKPQFVIDRLNIANPDEENPMGIAVFANAIDQLKAVDVVYDTYVNEFLLGKKRIIVQAEATDFVNNRPVFDKRETVYYVLPEDARGGSILQPVDMSLRTAEFNTGMQDMLNVLSSKCGFGENHYKYDNGNIATATQIISENSTLFRTIKKHEVILESVLVELCHILLRLGNTAMGMSLNEDVEISIDFDDSIIEDKQSEFNRDLQMLSAGIMNDYEARMKWFNEDEATAKAALPKMQEMVNEEQDEIE